MKTQRHNAISAIAKMQAEIKEEIAAKWRQVNDIQKEISKLGQSLQGYIQRRLTLEQLYRSQINAFIRENEPSTTSNLAIWQKPPRSTSCTNCTDVVSMVSSADLVRSLTTTRAMTFRSSLNRRSLRRSNYGKEESKPRY